TGLAWKRHSITEPLKTQMFSARRMDLKASRGTFHRQILADRFHQGGRLVSRQPFDNLHLIESSQVNPLAHRFQVVQTGAITNWVPPHLDDLSRVGCVVNREKSPWFDPGVAVVTTQDEIALRGQRICARRGNDHWPPFPHEPRRSGNRNVEN